MNSLLFAALSAAAGLAVGIVSVKALHAQQKPLAYVVGEIDVTNQEGFDKEYIPTASKTIREGGGKYLVGGGKSVSFYGEKPKRIAIMVFDNLDKAQATFTSQAYIDAKIAGDKYATFRVYTVEGVTQ